MNEEEERDFYDQPPENSLDLNMKLINPGWGKKEVSAELRKELSTFTFLRDKEGKILLDDQGRKMVNKDSSLWDLLGFYTRDMRLSNLNDEAFIKCEHYINLANDFLRLKFYDAFFKALSRAITILELRQSYKGFLRRRQGTQTRENFVSDKTQIPEKKGMFSKFVK